MCPMVPRTAVVTPKSPTTASKLSSSKMFAALTSLWIIFGLHCSCKYRSQLQQQSSFICSNPRTVSLDKCLPI
ncbi:hypothetical protein I3843_09G071100 [Carya illinoinensis]|nr:hypothetical protein I3843_09G071100 [Carya illinoinensis]